MPIIRIPLEMHGKYDRVFPNGLAFKDFLPTAWVMIYNSC